MVRELLHIQVGQCGNQIGNRFWGKVCQDHNINSAGYYVGENSERDLEKINTMMRPVGDRYVPRACLVDLEPGTVDMIKGSPIGTLFKPDNFVFGASGSGNNWAKGHYTEGAELIEEVMDVIRKEVENCDAPQGFQLMHSIGGGTGSGMGTLILLKLRDAYADKILTTHSVFPSPKVSDTVVEPYNAVLSSHQLLENCDITHMIDNEALYNISHNVLKNDSPNYADLNYQIACITSAVTASYRFPSQTMGTVRATYNNLVPFPRLHFLLQSYSPIKSARASSYPTNVQELTTQLFSPRNFFSNIKPDDGKYLTTSLIFGGKISLQEIDETLEKRKSAGTDDFVEWIPNNTRTGVIDYQDTNSTKVASMLANTTATKGVFQRLATQFGAMYKRKAFLHWYKGEGMDEMEFQEADKNVRDLITEYQDKQDATVGFDDED